jgi:VanZ family protein
MRLVRSAGDWLLSTWEAAPASIRWAAPLGIMAALWWSSSRVPVPRPPSVVRELVHNGMHVVAFGALAGALWFALRRPSRRTMVPARAAGIAGVALASLYGAIDELHQSFVPGRVSSFADLLADASGGALAISVLLAWRARDAGAAATWPWCAGACAASVAAATWLPI